MVVKSPLDQLKRLHVSDSVLYDFVTAQVGGAHVKDAKTGAYLLGNANTLKILGLKRFEQFIGRNVFEIDEFMRPYWGGEYAKNIGEVDAKAVLECKVSVKKDIILLNAAHQIYVHDLLKVPLIGVDNKPVALLTTVVDRTKDIDLFYLLELYRKLASNKNQGLRDFIRFLGIADFFHEELTYKEVVCLLHMRLNPAYKRAARKLSVTVKTIESHASHIIGKLKDRRLAIILAHLRETL